MKKIFFVIIALIVLLSLDAKAWVSISSSPSITPSHAIEGNLFNINSTNATIPPVIVPETPPSTGGGGGGGGAYIPTQVKSFTINTNEIKTTVQQGRITTEEVIVTNVLDREINVAISVSKVEDLVLLNENNINLKPKESKVITLNIIAKNSTVPDLYIGEVNFKTDGQEENILTAIEVESAQPLFDVSVKISPNFLYVMPNNDVVSEIQIYNLGEVSKEVDVNMEYKVLDWKGKEIVKEDESIAVNTKISYVKNFKIPPNAEYGRYVVYAKATYNGKTASGSDWFNVGKAPSIPIWLILVAVSIFLIIAMIILGRRVKKDKIKYRVDENALKRAGIIKRR